MEITSKAITDMQHHLDACNKYLTELDKDLSEEQQKEWNAIYASYRAGSVLTGRIASIDTNSITVKNKETGEPERITVNCLVIISYRVKVLIPESLCTERLWQSGKYIYFGIMYSGENVFEINDILVLISMIPFSSNAFYQIKRYN